MPLMWLLVAHTLYLEGMADAVVSPRSRGTGYFGDGVFGVRAMYQSDMYLGGSLALKAGTLGARLSDGTPEVNYSSMDVRIDLLAHFRRHFAIRDVSLGVGAMAGFAGSLQAGVLSVQGVESARVAFVPGIGYGIDAALVWRSLVVSAQLLLVSQLQPLDVRPPALFGGLSAGYVLRL